MTDHQFKAFSIMAWVVLGCGLLLACENNHFQHQEDVRAQARIERSQERLGDDLLKLRIEQATRP